MTTAPTIADPVHAILDRLDGVRTVGNGKWMALCPSHDDHIRSLSIGIGDTQPVVFQCMAGCENNDILAKINLTWSEILGPSPNGQQRERRTSQRAAYPTFELAVGAAERQTRGKHSDTSNYHRADGDEHFRVARFELPDGKTFRPFHRTARGWVQADPPGKLPLYRLPELLGADTGSIRYVVEGEKCRDDAHAIGLIATTSAHGCKSPKKSDWTPLSGCEVVILPDCDAGGQQYAQTVARIVTQLDPPATVKILKLPDLDDHGDIVDFVEDRRTDAKDDPAIRAEIEALAEQAPVWNPESVASDGIAFRPNDIAGEPYRNGQESMRAVNRMSATARQLRETGSTLAEQVAEWLDRRGPETLDGIEYPIPYAAAAIGVSRCHFHRLGQIGRVRRCCAARNTPLALSDRAIVPLARLLTGHTEAIPQAVESATEMVATESKRKGLDRSRPVNTRHTAAAVDEIMGPAPKYVPVRREPPPDADTVAVKGIRRQIAELADAAAVIGDGIPPDVRTIINALARHRWSRK